jgi:hypothetical protein
MMLSKQVNQLFGSNADVIMAYLAGPYRLTLAWRVSQLMSEERAEQTMNSGKCIRCGDIKVRRAKIIAESKMEKKCKWPTAPHCNEKCGKSQQVDFLLGKVFTGPEEIYMAGKAAFEKLTEPSAGWMKAALGPFYPGQ